MNRKIIKEFKNAMQAVGLKPPARINADGKIHHCSTQSIRDKSCGAYCLDLKGASGGFQNWNNDSKWHEWHAGVINAMTFEEEHEIISKCKGLIEKITPDILDLMFYLQLLLSDKFIVGGAPK